MTCALLLIGCLALMRLLSLVGVSTDGWRCFYWRHIWVAAGHISLLGDLEECVNCRRIRVKYSE